MSHDPKSLDQYADEQAQARFEENAEIARTARVLRASLREREEELAAVRRRLDVYESVDTAVVAPPRWLTPKRGKGTHQAIPCMLLTDIHYGERVAPDEIGDVNAYNTTIAAQRIQRAAEGAVKLCRDYMAGVEYNGFSLMLGGDNLSGDIHEELRETNAEATTESVVGVLELLVSAARVLADQFGRVHISGVVGNHGRTTRKPRAKKRAADNFDSMIYRLLQRELRSDDRFTVQIASGADLHVDVCGVRYALTHGDQFKGGSGISGALSPLLLGVHRKRRRDAMAGNPWDVLVMGHFHQSYFLRDLIVGGSVVGYNEYAYVSNLPFEEPQASLWLTTPERGISTYMPVRLLDKVEEGW